MLKSSALDQLPTVRQGLCHADATKSIQEENYAKHTEDERLVIVIQENLLVQREHFRTLPSVVAKLPKNELNLHGWAYKFETG